MWKTQVVKAAHAARELGLKNEGLLLMFARQPETARRIAMSLEGKAIAIEHGARRMTIDEGDPSGSLYKLATKAREVADLLGDASTACEEAMADPLAPIASVG